MSSVLTVKKTDGFGEAADGIVSGKSFEMEDVVKALKIVAEDTNMKWLVRAPAWAGYSILGVIMGMKMRILISLFQ